MKEKNACSDDQEKKKDGKAFSIGIIKPVWCIIILNEAIFNWYQDYCYQ